MKLTHTARSLALGMMLGLAAISAPAFAADGDGPLDVASDLRKMANKDGMVMKKDFLMIMEKKFDAMDKAHKGMLSTSDLMKIFVDKGA